MREIPQNSTTSTPSPPSPPPSSPLQSGPLAQSRVHHHTHKPPPSTPPTQPLDAPQVQVHNGDAFFRSTFLAANASEIEPYKRKVAQQQQHQQQQQQHRQLAPQRRTEFAPERPPSNDFWVSEFPLGTARQSVLRQLRDQFPYFVDNRPPAVPPAQTTSTTTPTAPSPSLPQLPTSQLSPALNTAPTPFQRSPLLHWMDEISPITLPPPSTSTHPLQAGIARRPINDRSKYPIAAEFGTLCKPTQPQSKRFPATSATAPPSTDPATHHFPNQLLATINSPQQPSPQPPRQPSNSALSPILDPSVHASPHPRSRPVGSPAPSPTVQPLYPALL